MLSDGPPEDQPAPLTGAIHYIILRSTANPSRPVAPRTDFSMKVAFYRI
jgi:hypothetical protein